MTTYADHDTRTTTSWPLFAALGAGTALVLTAIGTFWDIAGNDGAEHDALTDYLPVVGVVLVATALVYGLVVRTASGTSGGTRALVLSIVGFLSLAVFWSGLPAVLAFAACACALLAGRDGSMPVTAKVALGLSAVTVVIAVVFAIAG